MVCRQCLAHSSSVPSLKSYELTNVGRISFQKITRARVAVKPKSFRNCRPRTPVFGTRTPVFRTRTPDDENTQVEQHSRRRAHSRRRHPHTEPTAFLLSRTLGLPPLCPEPLWITQVIHILMLFSFLIASVSTGPTNTTSIGPSRMPTNITNGCGSDGAVDHAFLVDLRGHPP